MATLERNSWPKPEPRFTIDLIDLRNGHLHILYNVYQGHTHIVFEEETIQGRHAWGKLVISMDGKTVRQVRTCNDTRISDTELPGQYCLPFKPEEIGTFLIFDAPYIGEEQLLFTLYFGILGQNTPRQELVQPSHWPN